MESSVKSEGEENLILNGDKDPSEEGNINVLDSETKNENEKEKSEKDNSSKKSGGKEHDAEEGESSVKVRSNHCRCSCTNNLASIILFSGATVLFTLLDISKQLAGSNNIFKFFDDYKGIGYPLASTAVIMSEHLSENMGFISNNLGRASASILSSALACVCAVSGVGGKFWTDKNAFFEFGAKNAESMIAGFIFSIFMASKSSKYTNFKEAWQSVKNKFICCKRTGNSVNSENSLSNLNTELIKE